MTKPVKMHEEPRARRAGRVSRRITVCAAVLISFQLTSLRAADALLFSARARFPSSAPPCRPRHAFVPDPAAGRSRQVPLHAAADATVPTDDSKFVPAFSISAVAGLLLAPLLLEATPLASLLEALAVLYVMRGAANRNRLNGGTFRALALALVAAGFVILFDSGKHLVLATQQVIQGGAAVWTSVVPAARARVIASVAAVFALRASYTTLLRHGVPPIKTAVRCKESWLLSLVALGQALVAGHHLIVGATQMLYSTPAAGALRCFLSAACAHVCQTAAVAGFKRLSSTTYRWLNFSLVLAGLLRLYVACLLLPGGFCLKAEIVASAVQSLTAVYAWAVGTVVAAQEA
mmetsp:Transcript_43281/g.78802  ORF Transcript_43281/g.78802 Transcript_43281/m.78802 type:complete len:348 (+) Transcript_43281:30-1073(+)